MEVGKRGTLDTVDAASITSGIAAEAEQRISHVRVSQSLYVCSKEKQSWREGSYMYLIWIGIGSGLGAVPVMPTARSP